MPRPGQRPRRFRDDKAGRGLRAGEAPGRKKTVQSECNPPELFSEDSERGLLSLMRRLPFRFAVQDRGGGILSALRAGGRNRVAGASIPCRTKDWDREMRDLRSFEALQLAGPVELGLEAGHPGELAEAADGAVHPEGAAA